MATTASYYLNSVTDSRLLSCHNHYNRASCLEVAVSTNSLPFNHPPTSWAFPKHRASYGNFFSPVTRPMWRWDHGSNAAKSEIAVFSKENPPAIIENKVSNGQIGKEEFVSTTGVSEVSSRVLYLKDQQLFLVGFTACGMLGALSCFFLAAIPTLLAAESFGKLADATREELPSTMAAVRLSGMEISDLTMELSDLGQEITAGIRSSTRAVRAAEDGLRRMGSFTTAVLWQDRTGMPRQLMRPAVALAARNTREAIVQARRLIQNLIVLKQVSLWLRRYWWRIKERKLNL
ncbi:hypothetical protein O6H91_17G050300 [Diphasiastrum complanatum]|uniref:Uncharacterized protein n=1 Tax=Diphasiastrum complanatum TaxID=34168 RepID=A0ACC2B7L4_DIPCM|nr:hypothetical protein O6H91_17G050300 [Diphasiastrum complanatum]